MRHSQPAGCDSNCRSQADAQTPTAAATGTARTGTDGRATITLLYAESYVPWIKVKLVAQAIVSGTESSKTSTSLDRRFSIRGRQENDTVSAPARLEL